MSPVMGDPFARAMRARPSSRMPVPASSNTSDPLGVRTSIDGVFPPYRTVAGPGLGIDPRVPQKRRRKDIDAIRYRLSAFSYEFAADSRRLGADYTRA